MTDSVTVSVAVSVFVDTSVVSLGCVKDGVVSVAFFVSVETEVVLVVVEVVVVVMELVVVVVVVVSSSDESSSTGASPNAITPHFPDFITHALPL